VNARDGCASFFQQVVNANELQTLIMQHGVGLTSMSDSEVIMQFLCAPAPPPSSEHIHGADWPARIRSFMGLAATSYSLAFMTNDALCVCACHHCQHPSPLHLPSPLHPLLASVHDNRRVVRLCLPPLPAPVPSSLTFTTALPTRVQSTMFSLSDFTFFFLVFFFFVCFYRYAIRDPFGNRPLCIGKIDTPRGGAAWVVSSESCAFSAISAEFVRSVRPGELF
jgi:hypothetical protein